MFTWRIFISDAGFVLRKNFFRVVCVVVPAKFFRFLFVESDSSVYGSGIVAFAAAPDDPWIVDVDVNDRRLVTKRVVDFLTVLTLQQNQRSQFCSIADLPFHVAKKFELHNTGIEVTNFTFKRFE